MKCEMRNETFLIPHYTFQFVLSILTSMLRYILALCYRAAYLLHHALCLRPGAPLQHSQLIVIGSFRTGGAGKTPFSIWLCKHYAAQGKKVALLAHEYASDEVSMLRQKFSGNECVQVFATRNRYRLAHDLDRSQKFNFIVCDDGFEDSRLVGATTILLQWEPHPTKISELWPCGKTRSLAKDHDIKSPMLHALHCDGEHPDIRFVVDKVSHFATGKDIRETFPNALKANIICGLGNPERFCKDLQDFGIDTDQAFFFKDHSKAFSSKFEEILQKHPLGIFIITEKDAARLSAEFIKKNVNAQIYIAQQSVKVLPEVVQKLP